MIKILALSVGTCVIVYLTAALCLLYVPDDSSRIYLLPTIDTSSFVVDNHTISPGLRQDHFNRGMTISLYFFIFTAFAEGVLFLWALHRVRNFNEDFNLFDEIKTYAACWLFMSYLCLFLVVQGSYSGFLSLE